MLFMTLCQRLKLWNKAASGNCTLCSKQGTLNRILTFCKVALRQGRFNWRHDQVLREIMKTVLLQIEEFNSDTTKESKRSPSIFHKAGNEREKRTLATPTH